MSSTLPPWYRPVSTPSPLAWDTPHWAHHPKSYRHRPGQWFFVGQLAEALGRSVRTIHRWEANGWLPVTPYVEEGVYDLDGYEDTAGRRRLYSYEMVDAAARIADEEGILHTRRCCPSKTRFPERVQEAWDALDPRLVTPGLEEAPEPALQITPWPELVVEMRSRAR